MLSAVARLHGKFGVGVVAEVLAGAQTERTQRWGFDRLTVFGLLRQHSAKRIVAMLHRLMEAGLARQRDPEGVKFRPVMELTASGITVMKGESSPPASLVDLIPTGRGTGAIAPDHRRQGANPRATRERAVAPADDDYQPDDEAMERFNRLRAARSELARVRQLPPYVICHDTTLKLIARHAPRDESALEQIKGMGPHQVKMYGEALLTAVRGGNGSGSA
jgi:ATP-dependent DNA helicase RecQ